MKAYRQSNVSVVAATFLLAIITAGLPCCTQPQKSPIFKVPVANTFKNQQLIPWNTPEGQSRLSRSRFKADFFQLAQYYQPQANPLYCGIASSVILLNAMRQSRAVAPSQPALELSVSTPTGTRTVPFPAYSQQTYLNDKTDQIKQRSIIEFRDPVTVDPGLTLKNLSDILRSYDVKTTLYYAEAITAAGSAELRDTLKRVLLDNDHYLVANFRGKRIGAPTGGHISPLVAYDQPTDSVLVLDVAGHKNPWYWAPVTSIYTAMHTHDGDYYRGWLVVSDAENH